MSFQLQNDINDLKRRVTELEQRIQLFVDATIKRDHKTPEREQTASRQTLSLKKP